MYTVQNNTYICIVLLGEPEETSEIWRTPSALAPNGPEYDNQIEPDSLMMLTSAEIGKSNFKFKISSLDGDDLKISQLCGFITPKR